VMAQVRKSAFVYSCVSTVYNMHEPSDEMSDELRDTVTA
jgi:hypothetical protein